MFDDSSATVLDEIISARRTYRMFRQDVPPAVHISGIIQAGLAAPFAAAAAGGKGHEYFRQFFVFPRESRDLVIAGGLLMQKVHKMAEELRNADEAEPVIKAEG